MFECPGTWLAAIFPQTQLWNTDANLYPRACSLLDCTQAFHVCKILSLDIGKTETIVSSPDGGMVAWAWDMWIWMSGHETIAYCVGSINPATLIPSSLLSHPLQQSTDTLTSEFHQPDNAAAVVPPLLPSSSPTPPPPPPPSLASEPNRMITRNRLKSQLVSQQRGTKSSFHALQESCNY